MKTMCKKISVLLLAVCMLFGMTACSNNGEGGEKESKTVYEFKGAYDSTHSDAYIDFVLVLKEDGTLTLTPGVVFYDLEDYEANATGNWSAGEDGTLTFNIDDETGAFKHSYEVPLVNGGYQFEMNLSCAGYKRPITMTCSTEGYIPDGTESKDSTESTESTTEAEKGEVVGVFDFVNSKGSMKATIELCSNGSVVATYDMITPEYTLHTATGTWSQDAGGNYVISLAGDDNNEAVTITSTVVDGVHTIQWTFKYSAGGEVRDADRTLTYKAAE